MGWSSVRILPAPDSLRVEVEAGIYPTVHRDGKKGPLSAGLRPQVATDCGADEADQRRDARV
jgi:hypothetical protein